MHGLRLFNGGPEGEWLRLIPPGNARQGRASSMQDTAWRRDRPGPSQALAVQPDPPDHTPPDHPYPISSTPTPPPAQPAPTCPPTTPHYPDTTQAHPPANTTPHPHPP